MPAKKTIANGLDEGNRPYPRLAFSTRKYDSLYYQLLLAPPPLDDPPTQLPLEEEEEEEKLLDEFSDRTSIGMDYELTAVCRQNLLSFARSPYPLEVKDALRTVRELFV